MDRARLRRLLAYAEEELRGQAARVEARRRIDALLGTRRFADAAIRREIGGTLELLRKALDQVRERVGRLVEHQGEVARRVVRRLGRIFDYERPDDVPDFEWLPGTPESVRDEVRETWRSAAKRLRPR